MNSFERWWNQDETRRRFGPSMRDQEIWDAATEVERKRCKTIVEDGTYDSSIYGAAQARYFSAAQIIHPSLEGLTPQQIVERLPVEVSSGHPKVSGCSSGRVRHE